MPIRIEITYDSGRVERKQITPAEWKKLEPKLRKLPTVKNIKSENVK